MAVSLAKPILRTIVWSAVTGMRGFSGLAFVGEHLSDQPGRRVHRQNLGLLASRKSRWLLKGLAAAEMAADKLPQLPARTEKPSLVFRSVLGAVAGSSIWAVDKRSRIAGAVLGAACATAATYGSEWMRMRLMQEGRLPNWAAGLVEDLVVLTAGKTPDWLRLGK